MSAQQTLSVTKREAFGTGAARACRKEGMVPGIVYGANKNPEGIAIDPKALSRELQKPGFFARVFQLEMNGKNEQVLVKDIQLHPVTDEPRHIDFMRITKGTKVHVHVPLNFINEDKATVLKRGGVLNVVHHRLEVVAPAESMPESFTIDLAAIDLTRGVYLSDIKMPQGVVAAHPERDNTLATVVLPKADASKEDGDE